MGQIQITEDRNVNENLNDLTKINSDTLEEHTLGRYDRQ